jgi:hypothetical protein
VLASDEARQLLDSIDATTLKGMREYALIGVVVYTFAHVNAVIGMKVKDYYTQGRRGWVRLHEKSGKQHEVPCHHTLEQYSERLAMGVEQHLVRLQEIGADNERAAVTELGMRRLQLGPLAANDRPVLAPVELESFPRLENQRNKRTPTSCLLLSLPLRLPRARKDGHTAVGAVEPQRHQVGMQLLDGAPLLARPTIFHLQPGRQLVSKCVQLAESVRNVERRLHNIGPQIFANRVPR